ncbi:hypothetical protein Taro_020392 [Colocasia esculenta]|uniref:Uncharacterized protein n=1 Tax=Colocasia esculenta TaxID=4460 RepID=A0A843V8C1_COLES|nr:hypothetical protein [Colocasia esculenta]
MKSFRERVGSFAEPSAIVGRDRIDGDDPKRGEVEYDPVDIGFLRDDEDPMVAWVAQATTEQGEYELDEEADDPEDPPRPNTFLARAVEAAEEEGEHGDVGGGRQPHSSQFRAEEEDEVDLLGNLRIERAMSSTGGANLDDEVHFKILMLGPAARSQFMRETPAIASSQPRRKGSHTQSAALSQAAKGKVVATSQPAKGKGKDKGQACVPAKSIVIREPPVPAQKKKNLETLDPNVEETPSEDLPRLPSSRSQDSMTTGSPGGSIGGGDGDGEGDSGNDGDGGGGGGESGQGGGSGGGMVFTADQRYGDHCTQDVDHGAPVQYDRRRKFVKDGRAESSAVDSDSYNTMISDFERMSTHESVGSYGGHSYQPESSDTGYSSGYSGHATTGYPAPYFIHLRLFLRLYIENQPKKHQIHVNLATPGAEPTLPGRIHPNRPDSGRIGSHQSESDSPRIGAPANHGSKASGL